MRMQIIEPQHYSTEVEHWNKVTGLLKGSLVFFACLNMF